MKIRTVLLRSALLLAASLAQAQPGVTTIETDRLQVRWHWPAGRLELVSKPSGRVFLKDGALSAPTGSGTVSSIQHPTFGSGQALEVTYGDGRRDAVMLFPSLPFALVRASLTNGGAEPGVTQKVQTLSALMDLGRPAAQLKTFGTGGLLAPDKNPGSHAWLAVAEPESRNGVVFGWLTHDRGSGVLFSEVAGESVRVNARVDYGRLRLAPGKTEELETLAIGYFDDARLGLEIWADAVAKVYRIKLREQPTGYCTWYSRPNGGAADQEHLAELAKFAATNLAPFGFSVVQIDDGWQAGFKRTSPSSPKKDFTRHNPTGPYPAGMKAAADQIKQLGLVPGIWFMPFAGTATDPFFASHLDWFVKTGSGEPYDTSWGGASLDMTHPGARAHLRDVASRICRDWGYQYIKIDGLWTGTATKQNYVNSGYKEDNMGDAVFANPEKTNIEAYRDGLKLMRETIGPDVFILGCNGPQNMRSYGGAIGLVNAMRVGPDNNSGWGSLTRGPLFGTRHYFLHGRIWYNDPDPVYVRDSMPLKHAQLICSWVAISGQLNLSSEWLPGQTPERLDILKRTMPGHGLLSRPADLFDKDLPSLWLVTDSRRTPRRDVIGIFNWEDAEQTIDYPLEKLGLDANTEYLAFDYWQNAPLAPMKGRLRITVPAQSCRVIAVRPQASHPQLLSTSRHVTQGIVDVLEERWDAAKRTLSGRSKLVGGDAYELRVVGGAKATAIEVAATDAAAGVKASLAQDGQLLRAKIESPSNREVAWTIRFSP